MRRSWGEIYKSKQFPATKNRLPRCARKNSPPAKEEYPKGEVVAVLAYSLQPIA
ncbi:MAG: hypothetical protein ACK5IQ_06340 [Bacteroidales bacterium]